MRFNRRDGRIQCIPSIPTSPATKKGIGILKNWSYSVRTRDLDVLGMKEGLSILEETLRPGFVVQVKSSYRSLCYLPACSYVDNGIQQLLRFPALSFRQDQKLAGYCSSRTYTSMTNDKKNEIQKNKGWQTGCLPGNDGGGEFRAVCTL